VENSRIGRGVKYSDLHGVKQRIILSGKLWDWTWWLTVGLGVVVTAGLCKVVNSWIRRVGKQSD
jgi:hypothetical protein